MNTISQNDVPVSMPGLLRFSTGWVCGVVLMVAWAARAEEALPGKIASRLAGLAPQGEVRGIPGVSGNASGVTFCRDSGTFFVVINAPTEVVELTADWRKKRSVRLEGFLDTEGIACMGSNRFVVAEEGRGTLTMITIPPEAVRVYRTDGRSIAVDRVVGNEGLEGVAYDPASSCFYVVKEKDPRRIYRVSPDGRVTVPWNIERDSFGLRDLSDIGFDPSTGHLLILSHESATLVECTVDGREVGRLKVALSQAEGVTLDGKGNLVICGEPGERQVFSPKIVK